MNYKLKTYTPGELREKWKDAETHFPLSSFIFAVVWQFMAGMYPVIGMDVLIGWIFIRYSVDFWIQVLVAPLIFVLNYAGYIYFMTYSCRWLVQYYNKKSPPRQGIFLRSFDKKGMKNPELNYYHLRGVVYKWPVFFSKKSIFPWSVNFVLRKVGENKVHKNAWFGDVYVGLEFTNVDDGAVVLDGAALSSHVVDAIFGSLSIFEINIGKNAVIYPNVIIGPGAEVEDGIAIAPRMLLPKKWKNKGAQGAFLWGRPVPGKPKDCRGPIETIVPESFLRDFNEKRRQLGYDSD